MWRLQRVQRHVLLHVMLMLLDLLVVWRHRRVALLLCPCRVLLFMPRTPVLPDLREDALRRRRHVLLLDLRREGLRRGQQALELRIAAGSHHVRAWRDEEGGESGARSERSSTLGLSDCRSWTSIGTTARAAISAFGPGEMARSRSVEH